MSPPASRMRSIGAEDQAGGESGGMFVFDSKMGPKFSSSRISKRTNPDELQELRKRLRTLEHALSKSNPLHTPETSVCDISEETSRGTEAAGVDDRVRFLPDCSFRGKHGKTRYFGRSHYTTTVSFFQDVGQFMRRGHASTKDKEYCDMKKFKNELWSQEIQNHQHAFREQAFKLDEMVPARKVADQLVQHYFDTFDTTYRILHVPTFLQQYADYWTRSKPTDTAFVAQLLAVMAAGSCFYASSEPADREAYQKPAMKWIMAVQSYISCTFVSPDIDLRMLQIQCLLLVARLGVASDGDVAWASSGSLIRSAVTMGLHRDPTRFRKKARPFWCELRRRLWTTIVELDLKISLDRGVPPSVDLDECDCDAPSNWDDADMFEDMENGPESPNTGTISRNFYQNLLTKTLPLRYRIARNINTLKFNLPYDDALRMGEELLHSVQNASTLFDDNAPAIPSTEAAKHRFAQSLHMFTMRKFLLALHRPYSLSVVRLPKCSYSRKICLEGSLEILSLMELPLNPESVVYPHITQLGNGMFRDETFHAAITVCVELSLQAQEMGNSMGPLMEGMNSSVLMSMVQSQQNVMLQAVERTLDDFGRRIGSGGKGCKSYFFLGIILASVKSRIKGEDPLSNIESTSRKAVRVCRTILNKVPYPEALAIVERQPTQTPVLVGADTPMSKSSSDFDPFTLLSTDFGDFTTPMDLNGWFDGLDPGDTELWNSDFFSSLPPIP
ncbi:hypothetical protein N7492_007923 [Penicillium capsulatum]|uniref:Xylanolytic transcriptional activator regulatory domain-containing protein n=1 Tax=Penicillium capsulatum TaxID=69766 RepID=A0A9W9I356_9EURO|nr:hypothetical protein N7492_007923 [Penicillium capsulatum]